SVTKPTTVKSVCICSKACLLYSLWNLRVNSLHCVKRVFDPVFSDPPLLPVSTKYFLIKQRLWGKLHMLSLVCIARVFFFLGRVHVISTGPISTVQTEVR
ncbi:unnamed protein product, partial [Staurois parvus]